MKRNLLILLILITALLTGCGKGAQATNGGNSSPSGTDGQSNSANAPGQNDGPIVDPDKACYDTFTGEEVWGEDYAIYHTNNGQLRLFDAASGLCLPYCFDASCPHTEQGYKNASGEQVSCISYNLSSSTFSLRDDGSYFFDKSRNTLYQADREGRNRKAIAHVTDPVNGTSNILAEYYTKDDLFFTYVNNYEMIPVKADDSSIPGEWIPGDRLEKSEAGVYRINLNDGTTSYVYKMNEYDCLVYKMHVENGHLFFMNNWLDVPYDSLPDGVTEPNAYRAALTKHMHVEVYDYDLSTGELRQVVAFTNALADVYFGNGFFVVTYESADSMPELYRTSGEKIRSLGFHVQLCPSMNSDRYLYYQRYSNEAYIYGIYDIVEDTIVKEITISDGTAPGPWAAVVGDAYYFKGRHYYYVNAEDLWNGDMSKRVTLE